MLKFFSKDDVSAEAFKSLYGTTRKNEVDLSKEKLKSKIVLPLFEEITNYIYTEAETISKSTSKVFNVGNHSLAFNLPVFVEVSSQLFHFHNQTIILNCVTLVHHHLHVCFI